MIVSQGHDLHFILNTVLSPRVRSTAASGGNLSAGGLTLARLKDLEREILRNALEQSSGRIYGEGGAAERVGLKPTTLISRLKKLGIIGKRVFE